MVRHNRRSQLLWFPQRTLRSGRYRTMFQCVRATRFSRLDTGRRHSSLFRPHQPRMAGTTHPHREKHPPSVAQGGLSGKRSAIPHRGRHTARRHHYTTNNVAKKVIEFSITVPREQLRPNYGDGFRGAPLKITKRPSGSVKGNRGADDCQKEEESESETNV